jgi:hypothetical protein
MINKDKRILKPLFKRPYGASETKHSFAPSATEGPILCELCGTEHPDRSTENYSYTWGTIFGRQYVEECCGKFVEDLYKKFGDVFAEAFLKDFAENPTAIEFGLLRDMLPDILEKARQKCEKVPLVVIPASR